jgi:hypothetical protein
MLDEPLEFFYLKLRGLRILRVAAVIVTSSKGLR